MKCQIFRVMYEFYWHNLYYQQKDSLIKFIFLDYDHINFFQPHKSRVVQNVWYRNIYLLASRTFTNQQRYSTLRVIKNDIHFYSYPLLVPIIWLQKKLILLCACNQVPHSPIFNTNILYWIKEIEKKLKCKTLTQLM